MQKSLEIKQAIARVNTLIEDQNGLETGVLYSRTQRKEIVPYRNLAYYVLQNHPTFQMTSYTIGQFYNRRHRGSVDRGIRRIKKSSEMTKEAEQIMVKLG